MWIMLIVAVYSTGNYRPALLTIPGYTTQQACERAIPAVRETFTASDARRWSINVRCLEVR